MAALWDLVVSELIMIYIDAVSVHVVIPTCYPHLDLPHSLDSLADAQVIHKLSQ